MEILPYRNWLVPGLLLRAGTAVSRSGTKRSQPRNEKSESAPPHCHGPSFMTSSPWMSPWAPNQWLRLVSAGWEEEEGFLLPHAWAAQELVPFRAKRPYAPHNDRSHSLTLKKNKKWDSDVPLHLVCICCSMNTTCKRLHVLHALSCKNKHLHESEDLTRTFSASPADQSEILWHCFTIIRNYQMFSIPCESPNLVRPWAHHLQSSVCHLLTGA